MELSANIQEAIVIVALIVSLTIVMCMGKIAGDDYVKLMFGLMGYIFGRVLNHAQGKE